MLIKDIKTAKNDQQYLDLLRVSFEYLLSCIAEEYCVEHNCESLEEFNSTNNINYTKVLMYPFFVSLANGHSESLFTLFGDFYSLSYGPISLGIFKMLNEQNINLKFFTLNDPDYPQGIRVNNNQEFKSFNSIKNEIKNETLEILQDKAYVTVKFSEIEIIGDNKNPKKLSIAIESAISAINEQSNNRFFMEDVTAIKNHSIYFHELKRRYASNTLSIINYSELESGNNRPFYKEDILVN